MSDERSAQRLLEHEELRDIHSRIDGLKSETERNHRELTSKLHDLEVAVARGGKFPAAAWVAAVSVGLTVVGTGGVLFAKLETTQLVASQAFTAIKEHVMEMGPAEQVVWKLDERVKSLEGRIVGQGPDGWHRRDHEAYAEMVKAQIGALEQRAQRLEDVQAAVCDRVRQCKGPSR